MYIELLASLSLSSRQQHCPPSPSGQLSLDLLFPHGYALRSLMTPRETTISQWSTGKLVKKVLILVTTMNHQLHGHFRVMYLLIVREILTVFCVTQESSHSTINHKASNKQLGCLATEPKFYLVHRSFVRVTGPCMPSVAGFVLGRGWATLHTSLATLWYWRQWEEGTRNPRPTW